LQLCYVDESGNDETLVDTEPDQQPVIVIAGITLPESDLTAVTHEWIELKTRFHPTIAASGRGWLDAILADIKGTKCRGRFRESASPREKQHAVGFIDGTLKILESVIARRSLGA
jgi:DNA-binding GntR family transcriptional regulator